MRKIAEITQSLTASQMVQWRTGYRAHLESRGVPPEAAADLASKTAYRADLYPSEQTAPLLFQLTPTKPAEKPKAAKPGRAKAAKPASQTIIEAMPIVAKPIKGPLTARQERLVKTAAEIAAERAADDERAYMHSIMCQVGLPRSKVDSTSFERVSGGAALLVEAGKLWDGKKFVQQPIPYGPMPRLMLAYMNTYAVRFNSPEIPIGDSASEFLRMLGKQANGGERGSFTTFRKQIQALSACRMTLGFNAHGMAHTYDGKPIKHFEAWIASNEQQRPLWPGTVTFSEEYYRTLKDHAVPLDLRAYMQLKGSALAMDVYIWLAQRLHRIDGRPIILHWLSLRDHFGQEYTGPEADKNFKKKFLPALRAALLVYPEAKVKQVRGGVMLTASPPPVAARPARFRAHAESDPHLPEKPVTTRACGLLTSLFKPEVIYAESDPLGRADSDPPPLKNHAESDPPLNR